MPHRLFKSLSHIFLWNSDFVGKEIQTQWQLQVTWVGPGSACVGLCVPWVPPVQDVHLSCIPQNTAEGEGRWGGEGGTEGDRVRVEGWSRGGGGWGRVGEGAVGEGTRIISQLTFPGPQESSVWFQTLGKCINCSVFDVGRFRIH